MIDEDKLDDLRDLLVEIYYAGKRGAFADWNSDIEKQNVMSLAEKALAIIDEIEYESDWGD